MSDQTAAEKPLIQESVNKVTKGSSRDASATKNHFFQLCSHLQRDKTPYLNIDSTLYQKLLYKAPFSVWVLVLRLLSY